MAKVPSGLPATAAKLWSPVVVVMTRNSGAISMPLLLNTRL